MLKAPKTINLEDEKPSTKHPYRKFIEENNGPNSNNQFYKILSKESLNLFNNSNSGILIAVNKLPSILDQIDEPLKSNLNKLYNFIKGQGIQYKKDTPKIKRAYEALRNQI